MAAKDVGKRKEIDDDGGGDNYQDWERETHKKKKKRCSLPEKNTDKDRKTPSSGTHSTSWPGSKVSERFSFSSPPFTHPK